MIQALHNQLVTAIERPRAQSSTSSGDFEDLFEDAAQSAKTDTSSPASSMATSTPASTASSTTAAATTSTTLGEPDVQAWLTSYYTELAATNPTISAQEANIPFQPTSGDATNYPAGSVYGPDQVFTQALYNQNAGEFATETGQDPNNFMSQLPGVPSAAAQQNWDWDLAINNAQRLANGQAIDTAAYWSDPGSINYDGVTYTAQQLGYAGPGQSSGPEPIYISQSDQVQGTNEYTVPGYSGTVTGIQPNCYYTLQELQQAGLPSGQPDAQYNPGSWSTTTASTASTASTTPTAPATLPSRISTS